MKTILLILILSSFNLNSQWELITYPPVIPTQHYALKGDSVYVFRDYFGWFKSYDSGENWELNNNIFKNEEGKTIYPIYNRPYFIKNYVVMEGGHKTPFVYLSSDYGKTFNKCTVKDQFGWGYDSFIVGHLNYVVVENNEIYIGSEYGLYISIDDGITFYEKSTPGSHFIYHSGITDDTHVEQGLLSKLNSSVTSILLYDDKIYFTSSFRGSVFKNVDYKRNDTLNSIYFPIMDYFFYNKFNTSQHPYRGKKANMILKINENIFTDFNNELWKSNDKGDTWEQIETFGLTSISRLFSCGEILYAIEDNVGIFMSEDEGETWQKVNLMKSQDYLGEREITDCVNLQFSENYAFLQTNYGLCRAPLKDCKIVTDISSVESATTDPKIYPNPASESITISGIGQGIVTIYNTLGQKLIEKEIFGTSTINTNDLQTGMYVIKLESGGEVVFEKVIVNR